MIETLTLGLKSRTARIDDAKSVALGLVPEDAPAAVVGRVSGHGDRACQGHESTNTPGVGHQSKMMKNKALRKTQAHQLVEVESLRTSAKAAVSSALFVDRSTAILTSVRPSPSKKE